MALLFDKLDSPVLTDLHIDWPGSDHPEVWPERIPDLYAGEPVVVTARLPRLEGGVAITGKTGGTAWVRQLYLDGGEQHSGVAALWARRKISSLLDRRTTGADPEAVRSAVVAVALQHQLVSPYTSLVAVDRTPVRPSTAGLKARAVPSLMPTGSMAGFPRTATPASLHLLFGLAALLLAAVVTARRRTGLA